jgi:hypothetical protein
MGGAAGPRPAVVGGRRHLAAAHTAGTEGTRPSLRTQSQRSPANSEITERPWGPQSGPCVTGGPYGPACHTRRLAPFGVVRSSPPLRVRAPPLALDHGRALRAGGVRGSTAADERDQLRGAALRAATKASKAY